MRTHLSRAKEEELNFVPHPSHRLILSSGCGFRDGKGRHVILDIDGSGKAEFSPHLHWEGVDEEGRFQSFATATSESLSAKAAVLLGPPLPNLADPQEFSGQVVGSGWLLDGVAELDGHNELTSPTPMFPAPFFRSARGEGRILVSKEIHWTLLQTITIADPNALSAALWRVQNMSEITPLVSRFPNGESHSGMVASHLNEGSFEVSLPIGHQGVLIEKLGDHFHGRQRARVLVNQIPIGWWSEPTQDRTNRWRWGRFGIGKELLPPSGAVRIAVDPPAGAPLWSVSEYRIFVGIESSVTHQNME